MAIAFWAGTFLHKGWSGSYTTKEDHQRNKFFWQKPHKENKTGSEKAYKPNKIMKQSKDFKKYETWKPK